MAARAESATVRQLAASQLLSGIPATALEDLARRVERRVFTSGEVLCEVGDVGDSAFLVVSGRFRASAGDSVIGEIGRES